MHKQPGDQSTLVTLGLLASRLVLFLTFQAAIALIFRSWHDSEKYWLLTATLTNLVSITLLYFLFKAEGKNYLNLFRFKRSGSRKDILVFIGLTLLTGPVVFAPGYLISKTLWNDPNVPTHMMFSPIKEWVAYVLLIAFPVTITFAELATYFGYSMPKLREKLKAKWLAIALPVVFLSLQHCTLPFIPDLSFVIYRALVFLPFAILIGVSLYYRPSLFPYFALLHGLMDFATAFMFFRT